MPIITINTYIKAPIERCFNLARSIDFHSMSTEGTREEAVAGCISGLIGFEETVTWKATHFGVRQTLTSVISGFHYPLYFRDEMLKGTFKSINHQHFFHDLGDQTLMTDLFEFESPLGCLGNLANGLFLTKYLRSFLIRRNEMVRDYAESNKWRIVPGIS